MTKRRLIRKADTERVTEIVLNCAAVNGDPRFYWDGDRLWLIEVPVDCGLSAVEIVRLGERGIHPGADGWEIEEAPAIAPRPLPPGFGWFQRGVDSYSLDGPNGTIAKAHHDGRSWTWSILSTFVRTTARDLREAQERTEDTCRAAGLFDAPAAPDLGAKVDAIHDAAGAPLRALVFAIRNDAPAVDLEARIAAWGESLKSELRASLPAPPMPSLRTTDGALTAYLLEHHREEWRPGEDALALAIRLLGEASDAIADTREEARVADESAKELEAELARVRAALAKETERRVEAERGRGEALGDLAALRGGLRGLMAKMGAPHG